MGLTVWSIFLFANTNSSNVLFDIIGESLPLRFFIFCIVLGVIIFAYLLKRKETSITLNKTTWRDTAKILIITLILNFIALANLLFSLICVQPTQHL